jgi:uncharacterized membrane protein YeaQ/YmgE (transglycosylase-associated protein family)
MMNEHILQMGPMWVLAGLGAGWLADALMVRRGYGLIVDMGLGVAASLVGGSALLALYGPSAGMLGMLIAGFVVATAVLLGQRLGLPTAPAVRERKARSRLLELGRPAGQASTGGFPVGSAGGTASPRATRALVRIATSGIYLLRGVPLELQRAARARAVTEGTTLRQVLLKGLGEYAAGTWTPRADEELSVALTPAIPATSR